jgi:hypothetical protein
MPIGYTVRDITTDSITVDYDNGGWAVIPLISSYDKNQINRLIRDFSGVKDSYASTTDIPFNIGEKGQVLTQIEEQQKLYDEQLQQTVQYGDARQNEYPSVGDQLDALYWARVGKPEVLAAIDAQIDEIKSRYPKDMAPITKAEYLEKRKHNIREASLLNIEALISELES